MLDKIMISQDRKNATLYYSTGKTFNLYASDGQVLDLVAYFITPVGSQVQTFGQLVSTSENTQIIDLDKVG